MTKAPRGPGAPVQIKHSQEALYSAPMTMDTRTKAQLVVCDYVDSWYPDLDEAGKIVEIRELLSILGIR